MKYHPPVAPGQRQQRNYDKKPTGFSRLWELLTRDLGSFWKASFLCCLALLPGGVLVFTGSLTGSWLMILIGGILIGILGAPFWCGMQDTLLRALRDEPGYWWECYKRAWRQNWRDSFLPGVIVGVWGGLWGAAVCLCLQTADFPNSIRVGLLVSGLLSIGLFHYLFCQIPLVTLPLSTMVRNAFLMFIGYLPRTVGAMAIQGVYWVLMSVAMPYDVPLLVAFGFWLPGLFSTWLLYPTLENTFHISSELQQRRDLELEAYMESHNPAQTTLSDKEDKM